MSGSSDDDPLFDLFMVFVAGFVIAVASVIYTAIKALTCEGDTAQEPADGLFIGKEDDSWSK
jgi:hypothetical protein